MTDTSLQYLINFLDTLPEPRIVLNKDYSILGANRAYLEHYHVTGQSVTGHKCYEVSHGFSRPCDEEGESCPLKVSLKTMRVQRLLHIHHTPRGDEHVDVELTPIRDTDEEIQYFIEMIHTVREASAQSEGELVGRSAAFNRMLGQVMRAAPSRADVLLLGESGTGKELVAHAVHNESRRTSEPFVTVDCSSLPESLFESELFGYEKGAFSGAHQRKHGLVEAAKGGTLFLDEVGDIPLSMQVKLLRLLETGTYRRVGGIEPLSSDFRLISATHRDLKLMVAEGRFRQDLFYRINTFPILLPALRERMEDLPLLIDVLMKRVSSNHSLSLHPAVLMYLSRYNFPGNIRELRNMIERASLLVDGDVLLPEHFPDICEEEVKDLSNVKTYKKIITLEEMELNYLEWQVNHSGLGKKELAKCLGVSERTLFRKLGKID